MTTIKRRGFLVTLIHLACYNDSSPCSSSIINQNYSFVAKINVIELLYILYSQNDIVKLYVLFLLIDVIFHLEYIL